MILVPYAATAQTVPDSVLRGLWHQIEKDGISGIFNANRLNDAETFIRYLKDPSNLPTFVVENDEIVGMGWINGICENHAHAHHLFLKSAWGKYTVKGALLLLDYWFSFKDKEFMFDVLIGHTPLKNRKAIQFLEKIGFQKLDPPMPIKGGIVVSYITRESFYGFFNRQ
jgi:hypothetical protein